MLRLVHSLSEGLQGGMAGPKYKLKLMKHQGLKGNKVEIKLRETWVNGKVEDKVKWIIT